MHFDFVLVIPCSGVNRSRVSLTKKTGEPKSARMATLLYGQC